MDLLTTSEVAKKWQVSKQHVLKLVSENKLKYLKQFSNGSYIFSSEDLKFTEDLLRFKVMRRYGIPQFLKEEYNKNV